jgi:hydroxymethylbilane synthase
MKKQELIIGTRSSKLALWQANFIKSKIEGLFPEVSVLLKHITTKGDKIIDYPLSTIGGKGLFTKELEKELLAGTIDMAVHSLKDLQTDIPEGLLLAAVTDRHSVEDVLISTRKNLSINGLRQEAVIATGSLRRQAQILHWRPDLIIKDLRGNVNTRIKNFFDSDWDGIILARAGIERLGLEKHISSIIPLEQMLPAVGQGALGIEVSENNIFAKEIASKINDEDIYLTCQAERAFLMALGGGCQAPIAAYTTIENDKLFIDGLVCSLDGTEYFREKIIGDKNEPEKIGRNLADILLSAGADMIINLL